jgi:tetratricopeptide (TPR) repeat protein
MKRIVLLMLLLVTVAVHAQKQAKPNIKKAIDALQEGKVAEAKDIIDAATTYEKTMGDGKTWYYRGLIYTAIDTSSNEQIHALDQNAFTVAQQSFEKADSLAKKGSEYFTQAPNTIVPVTKTQQMEMLSNYYLDKGIRQYQDGSDYEKSLQSLDKSISIFEKQLKEYPNDSLAYYVTALVAHSAEKPDVTIKNAEKYFAKGGKSRDLYLVLYQIYTQADKPDNDKALEVVRRAKAARPDDSTFPKIEIELLINMGKEAEAKAGLEEAVKKEPNDKLLHFFLGYINNKLGNVDAARKNFTDALALDPNYFEAEFHLANTYLMEVDKVSKELSATGNTQADSKKRSELVQKRVKKSEEALPYLEKAEKMKATDKDSEVEVLQKLALLYYYTADDKNSARVEKKLKMLGVSDE